MRWKRRRVVVSLDPWGESFLNELIWSQTRSGYYEQCNHVTRCCVCVCVCPPLSVSSSSWLYNVCFSYASRKSWRCMLLYSGSLGPRVWACFWRWTLVDCVMQLWPTLVQQSLCVFSGTSRCTNNNIWVFTVHKHSIMVMCQLICERLCITVILHWEKH